MTALTLAEAIKEIETALPKVTWKPGEISADIAAEADELHVRGYSGEADGWEFIIALWRILPESMANHDTCDGAARKGGLVVRLPLALAKRAGELAEKRNG